MVLEKAVQVRLPEASLSYLLGKLTHFSSVLCLGGIWWFTSSGFIPLLLIIAPKIFFEESILTSFLVTWPMHGHVSLRRGQKAWSVLVVTVIGLIEGLIVGMTLKLSQWTLGLGDSGTIRLKLMKWPGAISQPFWPIAMVISYVSTWYCLFLLGV